MINTARMTIFYNERVDDLCYMSDESIRSLSKAELCDIMEEFDELESHICDIETIIANKRTRAKEVEAKVSKELKKRSNQ